MGGVQVDVLNGVAWLCFDCYVMVQFCPYQSIEYNSHETHMRIFAIKLGQISRQPKLCEQFTSIVI